jgi:hypothetical protein
MKKYLCLLVLLVSALQQVRMEEEEEDSDSSSEESDNFEALSKKPNPCPPHERWSKCGNLCEHSCKNICDSDKSIPSSLFQPPYTNCKPGCYCINGYIRTSSGCVLQKYKTCGTSKLMSIHVNVQHYGYIFLFYSEKKMWSKRHPQKMRKHLSTSLFQKNSIYANGRIY